MKKLLVEFVPGLAGGLLGGLVGYFAFQWLLWYGLFAPLLPGALAGLGCGLLSRTDSNVRGLLCGIEGLLVGIVSYWMLMVPPFVTDGTFGNFLIQIHKLPLPTFLMLLAGGLLGFWWGKECTLRGRLVDRKGSGPIFEE